VVQTSSLARPVLACGAMSERSIRSLVAGVVVGMTACIAPLGAQQQQQQPQQGRPAEVQVGVPRGSETDQQRDQDAQRRAAAELQKRTAKPVPRSADGRVIIGATVKDKGLWLPGPVIPNPLGLTDIPYQPWARAIVPARRREPLEPHTRCKPSGVARQFLTPYGVEIVDLPDVQRVYIFDIGGPHTFRTVYMDGRTHPRNPVPEFYGHSIGWWEGDTLVIDTVGFNEDFWLDRGTLPHTESLHTVERFTRTEFGAMRYELAIDDPGAYTKPFSGQMTLRWEPDIELFEYVCQESNYAPTLMVGEHEVVDRSSPFVP
jgi:hypothetical protein